MSSRPNQLRISAELVSSELSRPTRDSDSSRSGPRRIRLGRLVSDSAESLNRVHGSKSRSRLSTQRAQRRIGRDDSDRSRALRAKCYIESSNNSEKITTNLKKNVDIHIHVSHVQNISPSTKHKAKV